MWVHEINTNPDAVTHHCINWTDPRWSDPARAIQPGDMLVISAEWRDWTRFGVDASGTILTINADPEVLVMKEKDVTYDETAGERFARAMNSAVIMRISNDWVATVLSVHRLTMMARASIRSGHYDNRCWPKVLAYVSCPQGLRWVLI